MSARRDILGLRAWERSLGDSAGGRLPDEVQRRRIARRILDRAAECPQQRELLRLVNSRRQVATHKTRRAGATDALGHYVLAQMIAHDRWACVVVVEELESYTRNWLERPATEYNALTLLERVGMLEFCKVERSGHAITRISIPAWGSELRVITVANARVMARKRGMTSKLWIVEEAQDVVHLADVLSKLIGPTTADFDAHVVLNGTASPELDGLFAHAVIGDGDDWARAVLASWRNPAYGDTFEERWPTLVERTIAEARSRWALDADEIAKIAALTESELDAIMLSPVLPDALAWVEDLDPDLLRELFGRWVADSGRLVYNWRKVDYWLDAPIADDLGDVAGTVRAALDLLRERVGPADWRAVVSHDGGYDPDPAAWVVTVWAPGQLHAYELWSITQHRVPTDEQLEVLAAICAALRACGISSVVAVADLDAAGHGTREQWVQALQVRLQIALQPAYKPQRREQITALNLALCDREIRVVRGGCLDTEGRHLRWHPTKRGVEHKERVVRLANGRQYAPGDHCLDGLRYSLPYLGALGQRLKAKRDAARQVAPKRHRDAARLRRGAQAGRKPGARRRA